MSVFWGSGAMETQNGKSTQNGKVPGSNHTVALSLALVPNVITSVPVRVESDMCRDENRVSVLPHCQWPKIGCGATK